MGRWQELSRSRGAHTLLSLLLVLTCSGATFFLGRSIVYGVTAEETSSPHDIADLKHRASNASGAGGALLAAGGLAGLTLLRRPREDVSYARAWPGPWTLLFLLLGGTVGMLLLGLVSLL